MSHMVHFIYLKDHKRIQSLVCHFFLQLIFLYPTQKGKLFPGTRPNSQSKVRGFDKEDSIDLSGLNPPSLGKLFCD